MKLVYSLPFGKRKALEAIESAPEGYIVTIEKPRRSLEQNKLLWKTLYAISEHVVWHGRKLTPDNWKDILTASLKRQEVVPGIDGGFVILGASTRKMNKVEMAELLELCFAFAAQQGVEDVSEQEVT
jgi:hypothetical protein